MNSAVLLRLLLAAFCSATLSVSRAGTEVPAGVTPDAALARLRDGNQRFVTAALAERTQLSERRTELTKGQHPFAIVIACADSRVAPEIIFDQGLGDLFVVRNAGNLLDDHVIGSVEYAVEHLHATLVIVLGHSACGAVTAAVAGGEAPGHLGAIVESLAPAVKMARQKPGDAVENAVRINARLSAAALAQSEPILHEAATEGRLKVVAARYDLATGQVEFLP